LKKGIREIVPYPRFTKILINHFLSIHKSVPKGLPSEYGKAIPNTMLTDAIKQSEAYKAFIGYSTGLVPPKKTRDAAFELGKSISMTDVEIANKTRRIYETHARLVTEKATSKEASEEFGGELSYIDTGMIRTRGVTIRDTPRVTKKKSVNQSQKLKRIQTLTTEEQLVTDMIQALNASKNSNRSYPHTGGSSEGTGIILGGSENESDYSTEFDKLKGIEKEKIDEEEIEWTDDEEETDDEFVHGDEYVHGTMDEEMKDAAVTETKKDNEEITDAEKTDAEKTKATNGDLEQAGKLPLTSSSLSVSSSFGNQFLNLCSDTYLIGTTKESADTEINSLLDIQIQQEVPHIQSLFVLTVPVLVIPEPTILSLIPEISIVTPVTTLPPPPSVTIIPALQQKSTPIPTPPITTIAPAATIVLDPLLTIIKRVSELEKDVRELKQIDPSPPILATIRSQVLAAVDKYLGSSLRDTLKKNKKEKVEKQQMPEYLVKSSDKAAFDKYDQKKSLLADGEGIDQGVTDSLKKKRQHDHQDEGPSAGPNQVYELLKGTFQSSIELEYNIEECYKALSDQQDWNNPEGDRFLFYLSKPLPLKGRPGKRGVFSLRDWHGFGW
ncbi:hypothetical protein Tco_1325529, partial [Tanacetum coccineum]